MSITDLIGTTDGLEAFIVRILAAVLFGILIGAERQLKGHPAGIQTNGLVCTGSCLFTLVSFMVDTPEPTRIAAGIVSGIGFLCTGIIFKDGLNVKGINTAATIWCTASVGVIAATGHLAFGAIATVCVILVNLIFKPIAKRIKPVIGSMDVWEKYYSITVVCDCAIENFVRRKILEMVAETELQIMNLESSDLAGNKSEITAQLFTVSRNKEENPEKIIGEICIMEGVYSAGWKAD